MLNLDRRNFIVRGSTGVAAACLPLCLKGKAQAAEAKEPHFFLEVFIPGGMDCLYTFDARPLALTQAGLVANYMTEDPEVLTGSNGNTALVTKLVQPLTPHLDRFSVLNGVIMVPGFDGHDNNTNYLLSGNAFGGESLLPHLNEVGSRTPIDFVAAGGLLFANVTNTANSVPLTPASANNFAARLGQLPPFKDGNAATQFMRNRMAMNATGSGRFSAGAKAMGAGFDQVPVLAESLKALKADSDGKDEVAKIASLVGELFRSNMCKSVQLVLDQTLLPNTIVDTHAGKDAKASPEMVGSFMTALAKVISHLRDTAYDNQRSLLDVTTVLVGTEFGRTMRSEFSASIGDSGTDHNPLKNTILLGGKGIKGGLVAGGTDHQQVGEAISGAHMQFDPRALKAMGRPIDFSSLKPTADLPATYASGDYLDFGCIANTIYELFGAAKSHYRSIERNGPPAQVLTSLMA